MTATEIEEQIEIVSLSEIRPSRVNDRVYKPIDRKDPNFKKLVRQVRSDGRVKEPGVVDRHGNIVSGHRRYAAAIAAGLDTMPIIRRNDLSLRDDPDAFLKELVSYNTQRVKTFAEAAHETFITTSPEESERAFTEYRKQKSFKNDFDDRAIKLGEIQGRSKISRAKQPMLNAIKLVLEERKKYLPISVRAVHYGLLNHSPLIHASKSVRYQNDQKSYSKLVELLARARLEGIVPWDSIIDETRPLTNWAVWANPSDFLTAEVEGFAKGYNRNLLQSQVNHIEVLAEKLTLKPIIESVCGEFCVVTTIGKGFCSVGPRKELADRFRNSGRERLVIVMLSDFDPDGEVIAKSFARSMRDDFGIHDVVGIKAAISAEHVRDYKLPQSMKAKKGSSNYAKFVKEHGRFAYELEALHPDALQKILRDTLNSVIDTEAFNHEITREKEDWLKLDALRRTMSHYMQGVSV